MGIYEFNQLSIDEKVIAASMEGTFLHNRIWEEYGVNLYGFGGFYAEVWLHRPTNKVERVRSFNNTSALEPYLDDIKIDTFGSVALISSKIKIQAPPLPTFCNPTSSLLQTSFHSILSRC
jgi:hypothetical protein